MLAKDHIGPKKQSNFQTANQGIDVNVQQVPEPDEGKVTEIIHYEEG